MAKSSEETYGNSVAQEVFLYSLGKADPCMYNQYF